MITDHCSLVPPPLELLMSGGEGLVPGPGDVILREASIFLGSVSSWLTHCPEPQETVGRGSNECVTEKPPFHLTEPLPPSPRKARFPGSNYFWLFLLQGQEVWVGS